MIVTYLKNVLLAACCFCAASLPCLAQDAKSKETAGKQPAGADKVTYDDNVRAVFRNRCFSCHNQNQAKSDLALDSYQSVMQGGASGQSIKPGDPGKSRLWQLVNHEDMPKMPPSADKLPAAELALIRRWIELGAPQNSGSKVAAAKPAVDLTATSGAKRRTGPPPMPDRLPKEPLVLAERTGAVTAIAASPWAPLVAVAGQKQILLYNSDNADLLGVLPFPEGRTHVLRFSRSGALLMAGGGRDGLLGKVVVFDVKTGKRVTEVGDELDTVLGADINDDHTLIALGGPRKLVRIYSTKDGALVHEIKKHTDWITAIEFAPDGVLLATADRGGNMFVWEAETAREYQSLRGHTAAITELSWRLDSNLLASSSEDTTIRLWEMNNGSQVRGWGAHGGGAAAVHFTHDGRLVSTGRDRVTKIWDQNGAQQRAFEGFSDLGLKAVFTHDGKRVVAGDWTGEVRVWEAADGKRVANLSTNPPPLAARLDAANKSLAALQAEHQKVVSAAQAAQSAADKAQADLAAAQKAVNETQANVTAATAAVNAANQAVTQATAAQQAAAKAVADQEPPLAKLKEALAAAQAAAAKAPNDKDLAAAAAKQKTEFDAKTAQLDAAKKTAAEKAAALEKAKQQLAAAQKQMTDLAAALTAAQQKVPPLTAAVKPAMDQAAAAKKAAEASAANVTAAQARVEGLKQDIAFAQQVKVAAGK
jgi:WD40 repeat protein